MKTPPGLAIALIVLVLPAAASAAVVEPRPGPQTFDAFDSVSPKTQPSTCPGGKVLTSPGGSVATGFGEVVFDDLTPSADLKTSTVKGVEDQNGFADAWLVVSQGICAYPLGGMQRVSATSALNSSNKTVTVTCPTGKKVIGLGSDINAGNGQVGVDDMRPSPDLTSVTVQALEDQDGQSGPWNVTAYAVCANPPQGLERVSVSSPLNSSDEKTVDAPCPANKRVLGVGSDINAGSGQVQQVGVLATSGALAGRVSADEDEDGQSGPWSVTAFAICAFEAHRESITNARDSTSTKRIEANCAQGTRSGIGGEITGGLGQVGLHKLLVFGGVIMVSVEDQTGQPAAWSQTAHLICGPPLPGLNDVGSATNAASDPVRTHQTGCPGSQKVLGGGAGVAESEPFSGQVFLSSTFVPTADLLQVYSLAFEDVDGFSGAWALLAQAVCADPPPGLELVRASGGFTEEIADMTASCPPGKYLTGLAGGVQGADGSVLIDDIRPDAALRTVSVKAIATEGGATGEYTVEANAICANI